MLSDKLSDEVTVGEEFTIVGTDITLPVVGFTFAGTFGHVPIAYTSLDTWQTLLYGDDANGRFSAVALRADGAALDEIGEVEGVELYTKKGAYAGSPGYSAESSTMTLIRGFLLVISALVVGAFFTVWTIQRTRQIGLLKALGASSWYVIRDALGQLAILLAISITIGCLVALVTASFVGDDVPFNLTAGSTITTALVLAVRGHGRQPGRPAPHHQRRPGHLPQFGAVSSAPARRTPTTTLAVPASPHSRSTASS